MHVSDHVKEKLKKPLGKIQNNFLTLQKLSESHKIIAVGDICTICLLAAGIKPHLAVFDFKSERKELSDDFKNTLRLHFPNPKKYKNQTGTLSLKILKDAPKLLKNGGGVLIDGEEDLTALAFINAANEKTVVVYGQPKKGIVLVYPKKIRKKINEIIDEIKNHKNLDKNKVMKNGKVNIHI